MPYIRVEMFEGRTQDQKNRIAQAITKAFVDHANCAAEGVWVVFEDVRPANWMTGGIPGTPPAAPLAGET